MLPQKPMGLHSLRSSCGFSQRNFDGSVLLPVTSSSKCYFSRCPGWENRNANRLVTAMEPGNIEVMGCHERERQTRHARQKQKYLVVASTWNWWRTAPTFHSCIISLNFQTCTITCGSGIRDDVMCRVIIAPIPLFLPLFANIRDSSRRSSSSFDVDGTNDERILLFFDFVDRGCHGL